MTRSFRAALALRVALGAFVLFALTGAASVFALRGILLRQLDGTLRHLAEVEARGGASGTSSAFVFHEGVLLASPAPAGSAAELVRYGQLWTSGGRPLVRSANLSADLTLPAEALVSARRGEVTLLSHPSPAVGAGSLRSIVYPLELVGAAHGDHVLQVAAPIAPLTRTLTQFAWLVTGLGVLATAGAFGIGWRLADAALRPTREITSQAEAIEAGTLSARITAHADVAEFGSLVAVLNAMLARLDRAFQSQRRFTADASHELRGPLHVLRGDIEVTLKRERTPEEYRDTLARCGDEVARLTRIATDLLALARHEAGLTESEWIDVDLGDVARQVTARYRATAERGGVELVVEGDGGIVRGDRDVLDRAIGNLVDNAVRHAPPGTEVRLTLADSNAATITVSDQGPGIPSDQAPHLFERFYRGNPARPRGTGSGTGLGLAIARSGVEAHGGRIEFLGNSPGAVFRITIPHRP